MLFFNKNYHKKGFGIIGQIATMYKGQDLMSIMLWETDFTASASHKKITLLIYQEFNFTLGGRL